MDKSPDAFRTISEVAELLDTPAHVLRFWESRFPQIKPVKRAGGRRYYRPADMALLAGIRRLLHEEGLTIRGVQKILREQGVRHVSGLSEDEDGTEDIGLDAAVPVAEDVTVSTAPIPLFPTPRGDMAGAEVQQDAEDTPEPQPKETDMVDEAALLAALEGPIDPQPHVDDAKTPRTAPQDATAKVSAAPELPLEQNPTKTVIEAGSAVPRAKSEEMATKAPADIAGSDTGDVARVSPAPVPDPVPAPAPPPIPASLEITGHWLPTDLRGLQPRSFAAKRGQVEALMQRLEVLRNRVGDLGRVPRR